MAPKRIQCDRFHQKLLPLFYEKKKKETKREKNNVTLGIVLTIDDKFKMKMLRKESQKTEAVILVDNNKKHRQSKS